MNEWDNNPITLEWVRKKIKSLEHQRIVKNQPHNYIAYLIGVYTSMVGELIFNDMKKSHENKSVQ